MFFWAFWNTWLLLDYFNTLCYVDVNFHLLQFAVLKKQSVVAVANNQLFKKIISR